MKTLIFTADTHHSHASRDLRGIFSSKPKAIAVLKPIIKEKAKEQFEDSGYSTWKEMYEDLIHNLLNLNQTQGLDEEFQLQEVQLNVLDYK